MTGTVVELNTSKWVNNKMLRLFSRVDNEGNKDMV